MKQEEKILVSIILLAIFLFIAYKIYKKYIEMKISRKGIDFIKFHEGSKNHMYLDTQGLPTTGVGHLINQKTESYLMTKTLSDKEVDDLLQKDLQRFVKAANDSLLVPVNQHEFDAIVSILFNIGSGWAGVGGHQLASFISLTNLKSDKELIAKAIMKFRYPYEIVHRRAKEARLYVKGDYSHDISPEEFNYYFSL